MKPFSIEANLSSYNAYVRPDISEEQYQALRELVTHLSGHPNFADLANPTEDYEDAVVDKYSSVVTHHVSMIGICRNVEERRYRKLSQFKIDVYRLLNNCRLFQKALQGEWGGGREVTSEREEKERWCEERLY